MAEIDHLVFAAPDLDEAVEHVEALTGVRAAPGGRHVGVGTYNALMSLGDTVYLELIAPDPTQPDVEGPLPFGLDRLDAPQLVTFAIHPTGDETPQQLVDVLREHGCDPGELVPMSRAKPDGELLEWMLSVKPAYGTDKGLSTDGFVPFVIDWGASTHPAVVTPTGCELVAVGGSSPSADSIRQLHGALGLEVALETGETGEMVATLDTPNGRVELR